jgi:hypothetical protein
VQRISRLVDGCHEDRTSGDRATPARVFAASGTGRFGEGVLTRAPSRFDGFRSNADWCGAPEFVALGRLCLCGYRVASIQGFLHYASAHPFGQPRVRRSVECIPLRQHRERSASDHTHRNWFAWPFPLNTVPALQGEPKAFQWPSCIVGWRYAFGESRRELRFEYHVGRVSFSYPSALSSGNSFRKTNPVNVLSTFRYSVRLVSFLSAVYRAWATARLSRQRSCNRRATPSGKSITTIPGYLAARRSCRRLCGESYTKMRV